MSTKVMQAALKIALIKEEFTETEILKAVQLLQETGTVSSLLDYLAGEEVKSTSSKSSGRKTKPIDEQRSQAIIALEQEDPEKYKVLAEFDSLLRKGSVLPNVSDIRDLGGRLNKDFPTVKSRREAVSKLMTVLVKLSIEENKRIFQSALSSSELKDSEYQQLAEFIITGETNQ